MSRLTAPAAGLLAGLAAVLVLAAPAAAHARLLGSTPKDGGSVTDAVTEIELRFSEPVRQDLTTVRVTGSDGAPHQDGGPRVVDGTVTQAVSALPGGPVQVGWRTVSADGHTIQGAFTFTNRVAAPAPSRTATVASSPPAPPTVPPTVSATVPLRTERTSVTFGPDPVVVAGVVAGAAVAGLAGLWWWRRRT